jgi:hypothetical protein
MLPTHASTIDIGALIRSTNLILDGVRDHNADIPFRIFGSAALALRCPENINLWRNTNRDPIRDIDLVTLPEYRARLRKALKEVGFLEHEDSIATNAQYQRLYFRRDDLPFWVEVHSAPLIFHHKIYLDKSLSADPDTLTPADLAISKLQWKDLTNNNAQIDVVDLRQEREHLVQDDEIKAAYDIERMLRLYAENTSQLIDLCVLFAEYPMVHNGEARGISIPRFLSLTRHDWGLWVTLQQNLQSLEIFVSRMFSESEYGTLRSTILGRIADLRSAISILSETSIKWKIQSILHRIIPERLYPVGYPVEEPQADIWGGVKLGEVR